MKRRTWLWRVRRNPLRRRSYAVEAWAFLVAGLIAVTGAALVGGSVAHDLRGQYAQQRLERHISTAVLTQDAPDGYGATRVEAPARWTAPDGTSRTGTVKADPELFRGAAITVWTDDRGALVATPLSAPVAQFQADITAASVAFAIFAGFLLGCVITTRFVDRRRCVRWAVDWAAADARWGHRNV